MLSSQQNSDANADTEIVDIDKIPADKMSLDIGPKTVKFMRMS